MEASTFRDGITDEEVLLKAATEDEAVSEAKAKWADVQARYAKHPPTLKANPNPRVIYKISIQ
ncbi:MAG: hypothetical protein Q8N43_00180 [Candidatus Azambacteria bacterium]|nr:hypothetical protein [Candidatus Azambacteria bacterium]